VLLGACALRTPQGVEIAPHTYLNLARELVYLPPEQTARLVAERPGAPVLGAVLTTGDTPRLLVLYDGGLDERGKRRVEYVGWDDAPGAQSLVRERLLARARN
jgi:hypothetical protein